MEYKKRKETNTFDLAKEYKMKKMTLKDKAKFKKTIYDTQKSFKKKKTKRVSKKLI